MERGQREKIHLRNHLKVQQRQATARIQVHQRHQHGNHHILNHLNHQHLTTANLTISLIRLLQLIHRHRTVLRTL